MGHNHSHFSTFPVRFGCHSLTLLVHRQELCGCSRPQVLGMLETFQGARQPLPTILRVIS